jgi:diguanylate cyclase (GGDEF)-like protein/PAS domain S-box-containing protein
LFSSSLLQNYIETHTDTTGVLNVPGLLESLDMQLASLVPENTSTPFLTTPFEIAFEGVLQNSELGVFLIDEQGIVQLINQRCIKLLDIPPELYEHKRNYSDYLAYHLSQGEYAHLGKEFLKFVSEGGLRDSPPVYERVRPNGRHLEVRTVLLKNGSAMRIFADITDRKAKEKALAKAEKQFRSLFENSFVGLYSANLKGEYLRLNPQFLKWFGIKNEAEGLALSPKKMRELLDYTDKKRRDVFFDTLFTHCRVVDFVSEIHNHFTGEKMWIAESAWVIRNSKNVIVHFEGSVKDITDQVNNQSKVAYLALHDVLTGLPNRAYMNDKLKELLMQHPESLAVHFLDLDRFKAVNDTLGHAAGDDLLKQVAARLNSCLHKGDFIARLGGDEFAILQINAHKHSDMDLLAAKIIENIAGVYKIGPHKASIGASIGIASVKDAGHTPEILLQAADAALYHSKNAGRGVYSFFDPEINAALQKKRQMEADLKLALRRNQLMLVYQPLIKMDSCAIYGFEALARWKHPTLGFVPPDQFITLAEECGLIDKIGDYVLMEACKTAAAASKPVSMSINVSALQFRNMRFLSTVAAVLQKTGLEASRVTLEMTETALIADPALTRKILAGLNDLGVKVSLDDFGSGNASISYLQKYHFDKIKIDRTYVSGTENPLMNHALLNAVMSLGRDLSIDVVAEGIETKEQHEALLRYGCSHGQGYYYGRPQNAEEWAELRPLI